MRVIHHPVCQRHDPHLFFRRGTLIPHPERAARYIILRDAAASAGHHLIEAADLGLDPILAVHDAQYIDFLRGAWDRRDQFPGAGEEILTGHFARPHMRRRPSGPLGLLGFYLADTSTPIRHDTWEAIYGSAQVAAQAAGDALAFGCSYALCRPPGHHAYSDSAGGFCYLNNASIAAERLKALTGGQVAILDIDVHHGNGTQGVFYARSDVVTASIHADPEDYYPFYAGYSDEIGEGAGRGCNRNFPLPQRSADAAWLNAIAEAIAWLSQFQPLALVVSLGLDASEDDPIGAFKVTETGFSKAAEAIGALGLPTVLVQEGGYLCDALPRNLIAFLKAFQDHRP